MPGHRDCSGPLAYSRLGRRKISAQAYLASVVAISFVEARIEYDKGLPDDVRRLTCCRSGGDADWDEQRLLSKFWRYFAERAPRVVTWNGKGFDLPVLRARAMMYGISAQSWYQRGTKWDNYMQRFAPDWHCDLMEQLSDYRACASMSLDDVALVLGLPGKIGGHGSEVEAMVTRGELINRAVCSFQKKRGLEPHLYSRRPRPPVLPNFLSEQSRKRALLVRPGRLDGSTPERRERQQGITGIIPSSHLTGHVIGSD